MSHDLRDYLIKWPENNIPTENITFFW